MCGYTYCLWRIAIVLLNPYSDLSFMNCVSGIVVEVIKTVLFFYQDILHKNKTHKYLNTPKKRNKAHKLGDICPDEMTKKIINNFLFKNKV